MHIYSWTHTDAKVSDYITQEKSGMLVGKKRAKSYTEASSSLISVVSICEGEKDVEMTLGSNLGTHSREKHY